MNNETTPRQDVVGPGERSPYRAPSLVDHGSVHELIQGVVGSAFDGMSGMSGMN